MRITEPVVWLGLVKSLLIFNLLAPEKIPAEDSDELNISELLFAKKRFVNSSRVPEFSLVPLGEARSLNSRDLSLRLEKSALLLSVLTVHQNSRDLLPLFWKIRASKLASRLCRSINNGQLSKQ